MQSTSATWRSLWAAGAALEVAAEVVGSSGSAVPLELSDAPVIRRGLMDGGLSVGNAVSASCALSLRGNPVIPKSAEVRLRMRLADGAVNSEWLPAGTFYISRRSRDGVSGVLALECYDALLKANALWTPSAGSWPRPMTGVAAEIAALLGLEQDPRNAIPAGYAINQPAAGTTLREVLSGIGARCGGNWIVTPANRLRLVPLADDGRDEVQVEAVLGGIEPGAAGEITGVRCETEDGTSLFGDETGYVISAALAPVSAADMAEDVIGMDWQPFTLRKAVYDPAAELGDRLTGGANGEVDGVLCAEAATLGPAFRGDVSAPEPEEVADEYPYIGANAQALRVLRAAVTALEAAAILEVDVEYALGTSRTTAPATGWTTDAPPWQEGYTIWTRTATTTAAGTTYSDPACLSGRDGQDGADGEDGQDGQDGVGVSAVAEQYYLSTSSTTQAGGSWSTAQPAWQSGRYIWTRSAVTWTDGSTTTTAPVLAKAVNGANQAASDAADAVDALDDSLTQREIFNRLTDGGAAQGLILANGQLYINATYISTGMISSANGNNYWNLNTGALSTQQGTIGSFTLDGGALTYSGSGSAASIGVGGLYFAETDDSRSRKVSLDGSHLTFAYDNVPVGRLYVRADRSTGDRTMYVNLGGDTETAGYALRIVNGGGNREDLIRLYYPVEVMDCLDVTNDVNCSTLWADSVITGAVSGDTQWLGRPVGVAYGGTGAATAAAARANLDVYSKGETAGLIQSTDYPASDTFALPAAYLNARILVLVFRRFGYWDSLTLYGQMIPYDMASGGATIHWNGDEYEVSITSAGVVSVDGTDELCMRAIAVM